MSSAEYLPYADFLELVLGEEVAAKTAKNLSMPTVMARFPFVKPLETFDFAYQPSINNRQVLSLASCQLNVEEVLISQHLPYLMA